MVARSWLDGLRRVLAAPAVIAGVFAATLLTAAPLALAMRGAIESHLGRSLVAGGVAEGIDYDWWQEFASQATGLGATFSPTIVGFAATLRNLSGLLSAQPEILQLNAALAFYLLAWAFLSGGILDRYARRRPTRAHGFFAAAGTCFWRFLRLGILAGIAYWFLFTYVHEWLFGDLYTRATRDVTAERVAFAWRAALYAVFGALLLAVNVTVDYARIRAVVEDRRSAIGAVMAALGFIARHPGPVAGLYALNALVFVLLLAAWAVVSPGVTGAGLSMWLAFLGGQLYILARLLLKLQFMASQTALFQSSLAHAGYAAAPAPVWPESPAAEAIAGGP